jgi:hypothetical protein
LKTFLIFSQFYFPHPIIARFCDLPMILIGDLNQTKKAGILL